MIAHNNSNTTVATPPTSSPARVSLSIIIALAVILLLTSNTIFISTRLAPSTSQFASANPIAYASTPGSVSVHDGQHDYPPVFIYRRTKKTASSSMLTALIDVLSPYQYVPLYHIPEEISHVVRRESRIVLLHNRRRLLVAQHNHLRRSIHPQSNAIIADTIRPGYEQITSFCRYVKNLSKCDDDLMLSCLKHPATISQITYRWAGDNVESSDTYIDIPLSSAHPALSTTVFRSFFPLTPQQIANRTSPLLDIQYFNVHNSTCPEIPSIKKLYDQLYVQLDKDIDRLAHRLLVLAGYTTIIDPSLEKDKLSMFDLLDAAERLEKDRINWTQYFPDSHTESTVSKQMSDTHQALNAQLSKWVRHQDGHLVTKRRF